MRPLWFTFSCAAAIVSIAVFACNATPSMMPEVSHGAGGASDVGDDIEVGEESDVGEEVEFGNVGEDFAEMGARLRALSQFLRHQPKRKSRDCRQCQKRPAARS